MDEMQHRIRDADPDTLLGTCLACGPNTPLISKSRGPGRTRALRCRNKIRSDKNTSRTFTRPPQFRDGMVEVCERCGFIPEDMVQLNADHVVPRWAGGTNDPLNRQTLCCNCHALKTKQDTIEYRKHRAAPGEFPRGGRSR